MIVGAAPADPTVWEAMLRWADAHTTWDVAVLCFGLAAQSIFFMRWIVQWVAAERRRVSHIPVTFWWLSLAGATLLLAYFALRREPVGMLGQAVGWVVYSRNLALIRRGRAIALDDVACAPRPVSSGDREG
jgi:lipid-A-disaccharide synthase-like uncharacterized protein